LNPSPDPSSLVLASGTFHIKRVGSVVTVETTVNGQGGGGQVKSDDFSCP